MQICAFARYPLLLIVSDGAADGATCSMWFRSHFINDAENTFYEQTVVPGFNPQFSFPVTAAAPGFVWPTMSPPVATADMAGFNWMYPPIQPGIPSHLVASQPPQFRPLSWRTTLCRHFVKNQGWCPLGDDCG